MAHHFLRPVTRTTQTGDICREMVSHLIRGHWAPGEKIPAERELCLQLGVGRASLREALKALEIMGLIETRLGDGTYVCERSEFLARPLLWAITSSSDSEVQELIEARRLIEVELAGLAARRATSEDLEKLARFLEEMERSQDDPDRFLQADLGFHLALGEASHNSILLNALSLIRNLLRDWIGSALQRDGVAARALQEHRQIHRALTKQNVSAARSAMQTHLQDMSQVLLKGSKNAKQRLSAISARKRYSGL